MGLPGFDLSAVINRLHPGSLFVPGIISQVYGFKSGPTSFLLKLIPGVPHIRIQGRGVLSEKQPIATMPVFPLDPQHLLSYAPAENWDWMSDFGADPLKCWPHEYDSAVENRRWSSALAWDKVPGFQHSIKRCTSYEQYAFNYAFSAMYDFIPCGYDKDRKVLLFDAHTQRDFERKQRNFLGAFQFPCAYPQMRKMTSIGFSYGTFIEQVKPTIYSLARRMNFLDPNLRFWEYNHTEFLHERVLWIKDGAPLSIACPSNRYLQRLVRSGKYCDFVLKFDYTITTCGFPIDYNGLFMGVRHDSRMHGMARRFINGLYPWEYGLGDKAYIGWPHMVTEYKKPNGGNLTQRQLEFNLLVQHYRGRNEHLIRQMRAGKNVFAKRWMGSFSLFSALTRLAAHMTGLQERMKGPRYDVYGPWPVCSDAMFRAFPKH